MSAQESSLGDFPCHYADFLAYAGLQRCAHLVNAAKEGAEPHQQGRGRAPEPRGAAAQTGRRK
jgi:hypothetical protein